MGERQVGASDVAAQGDRERETTGATRRQAATVTMAGGPHTRPGDQNALCIETDQA